MKMYYVITFSGWTAFEDVEEAKKYRNENYPGQEIVIGEGDDPDLYSTEKKVVEE